jgi:hypothetical protein
VTPYAIDIPKHPKLQIHSPEITQYSNFNQKDFLLKVSYLPGRTDIYQFNTIQISPSIFPHSMDSSLFPFHSPMLDKMMPSESTFVWKDRQFIWNMNYEDNGFPSIKYPFGFYLEPVVPFELFGMPFNGESFTVPASYLMHYFNCSHVDSMFSPMRLNASISDISLTFSITPDMVEILNSLRSGRMITDQDISSSTFKIHDLNLSTQFETFSLFSFNFFDSATSISSLADYPLKEEFRNMAKNRTVSPVSSVLFDMAAPSYKLVDLSIDAQVNGLYGLLIKQLSIEENEHCRNILNEPDFNYYAYHISLITNK